MSPEQILFSNSVISLFTFLSKPCRDREGGPKLDAIISYLSEKQISHFYEPGIGVIVNPQENPRIILTSHMDLIRTFQKGFEEGQICRIVEEDGLYLQGALDNTITNAFAILALEEILLTHSDVELVLTEGEEVGMVGMRNYLRMYPDKSVNAFFVNLDVTNDGWGKDASVEYDRPSEYILRESQKILSFINPHFTNYRVCDDIDAVNSAGCSGFSYCLPTRNMIHSYSNMTDITIFTNYFLGLVALLKEVQPAEEMRIPLSYVLFKEIIVSEFTSF